MAHHILQHFEYEHVRPELTEVAKPYKELAHHLDELLDEGPEKNIALVKLLESCDMALRSYLMDVDNHARDAAIKELSDALFPTPKKAGGVVPGQRTPLPSETYSNINL